MIRARVPFAAVLAAGALFVTGCGGAGRVRAAVLAPELRARLSIGFIENRHGAYQNFPVKNFVDMLEFQFLGRGFEVLDFIPPAPDEPAAAPAVEPKKTQADEKAAAPSPEGTDQYGPDGADLALPERDDSADDLFPRHLRRIAGERYNMRQVRAENRYLTRGEIVKLAATSEFDFFIQGAVGTTEQAFMGAAFGETEDSLIFLRIYNRAGQRVGAISFGVEERDYSGANFLHDITDRIVTVFAEKLESFAPHPAPTGPQPEVPAENVKDGSEKQAE